jgi:NADP-dependent 3-hydroxy acid dehydrogenase YdfG
MSDYVWLITGASSGFGKYIATEALRRGYKVIATARKVSTIEQLHAAGAGVLELDVTWDDQILAAKLEEANQMYGKITHVVNCAGYILEGAVEEARYAFDSFVFSNHTQDY